MMEQKMKVKTNQKKEPKILAFLCNWCSYAGADLAGVSRLTYPPNVRIIRLMCSGRIDPAFILKALSSGIEGVLVCGCHPGDCHYIDGNHKAEERIKTAKDLLSLLGFDSDRVRLQWVSASEGQKFAQVVTKFTQEIKSKESS